jgi:hypothetical protein
VAGRVFLRFSETNRGRRMRSVMRATRITSNGGLRARICPKGMEDQRKFYFAACESGLLSLLLVRKINCDFAITFETVLLDHSDHSGDCERLLGMIEQGCFPTGLTCGQKRAANFPSMIATGWLSKVSCSEKNRPLSSGIPIGRK